MIESRPTSGIVAVGSGDRTPNEDPSRETWRAPTERPREEPERQRLPGEESRRDPHDPNEIDEPPPDDDPAPEKRVWSTWDPVRRANARGPDKRLDFVPL